MLMPVFLRLVDRCVERKILSLLEAIEVLPLGSPIALVVELIRGVEVLRLLLLLVVLLSRRRRMHLGLLIADKMLVIIWIECLRAASSIRRNEDLHGVGSQVMVLLLSILENRGMHLRMLVVVVKGLRCPLCDVIVVPIWDTLLVPRLRLHILNVWAVRRLWHLNLIEHWHVRQSGS